MAQDQRSGAGGQQQTRRSVSFTWTAAHLGFTPTAQARVIFRRISPSPTANTGFIITTNPAVLTGATEITATATEPVGGGLPGQYAFALVQGQIEVQSRFITFPPAATGTVATATWTNTYFADNKLTSTLTFSHAVTGVTTADFVVVNDAGTVQTGANAWTFDSVSSTIAASTGTQIAATPPSGVTADGYRIRLYQDSVRGPSATSNNSPAAAVDTPNIAVGNTTSNSLTYSTRINFTYPSGIQALHANMAVDNNGFYFAASGKMYAFDWDGTRDSARDVTFAGLSASQTIWGFTKRGSNWVVMTRETGTNTIAMVREYSATGTNLQNFSIADRITTVSGETFRAPKGLITDDSNYYVRVVRSVAGNMRISKYTMSGAATNENIVLAGGPTVLSDLAESDGIMYILQQREFRLYATRLSDTTRAILTGLQTQLESSNNSPWAAAAFNNSVYVAQRYPTSPTEDRTQAYIYQYSGAPEQTVVVLTAAWTNVNVSGGFLRGTITFTGGNVSGIAASDFEVINDDSPTPTVQSWTISTPQATAVSQIISARIPTSQTGVNDRFALRLKATSVRGGTATSDNSPSPNPVTSSYEAIDTRPAVAATVTWGTATYTSGKLQATITFSSSVTGIETTDFEVINDDPTPTVQSGWTFDSVTASGTSQTIAATPPAEANDSFALRIKRRSTRSARATSDNSPDVATASGTVAIDTRTAVGTWSNVSYDASTNKLSGTITFNLAVTGIQSIDFHVLTGANGATTGWTFDNPSATSAAAGTGVTIRANPPRPTNGNFKLELRRQRVSGPNSSGNDSPSTDTRSASVAVDNRPIEATASWSNVSYDATTNKLQGTITFSHSVTGIEDKDFVVVEGNTPRSWTFDSLNTSGTSATVRATAPVGMTNGSFALRLNADSVHGPRATSDNSPENPVTSAAVDIDNRPVTLTAAWSNETFAGGRLQATLTFTGGAVRGIEAKDFEIVDSATITVQNNWTIATPNATATSQTIYATPPDPTMGSYNIILKQDSVLGPRATMENSPATSLESADIMVDTSATPTGGGGFMSSLVGLMARDAIMSRNMNRRNERR